MIGKMLGTVASVPAGMVRSFESVPGIGHAVSSANAEIFELLGAMGGGAMAGQLPEPPELDPTVA